MQASHHRLRPLHSLQTKAGMHCAHAGGLSAYTTTPLNQLAYLNQNFTARVQAKTLGQSPRVLEDCNYRMEIASQGAP